MQDEASSATLTELELEKQQEEVRTKCRFEQGEGSSTERLSDDQVNMVLDAINLVANENEANITQHVTRYFHQIT